MVKIRVKDLAVRYGDKEALKGISLSVPAMERDRAATARPRPAWGRISNEISVVTGEHTTSERCRPLPTAWPRMRP